MDIGKWLIRHGESAANAGAVSTVPATIPLTSRGVEQADRIAATITSPPSLIVASGYLRAQQTAAPTRERFHRSRYEIWDVEEFTYLGSLHGRPLTGDERLPLAEAYWQRADPYYIDGPEHGAESFADLMLRAGRLVERLADRSGDLVTVFSHGVFIRAVDWYVRYHRQPERLLDMRAFFAFQQAGVVPNGSASRLVAGRLEAPAEDHLRESIYA